MTYVVLGMHKSGTTLVAEILHRSGIPMVEVPSEADYDAGNKWERKSTCALNKNVLEALDRSSLSIEPPDAASLLREGNLEQARRLVSEMSAQGEWGFKDPRTCLTWPLWRRVLNAPHIIGVYRHHGAVVRHFLTSADEADRVDFFRRLGVERLALRRWCEYNERILEAIEHSDGPSILLSYDRLMQGDEELDHLRRFLGRDVGDPRRPENARHRNEGRWRSRLGAWTARLSGTGSAPAVYARLEAKRAEILAS